MTLAPIIPFDRRTGGVTDTIHVPRASLSAAAENALAGSRLASEALERAIAHVWADNRAAVLHELGRIGFELQGRMTALTHLTHIAETSTACPDSVAAPGHGRAA